jgi:hypothetical protein
MHRNTRCTTQPAPRAPTTSTLHMAAHDTPRALIVVAAGVSSARAVLLAPWCHKTHSVPVSITLLESIVVISQATPHWCVKHYDCTLAGARGNANANPLVVPWPSLGTLLRRTMLSRHAGSPGLYKPFCLQAVLLRLGTATSACRRQTVIRSATSPGCHGASKSARGGATACACAWNLHTCALGRGMCG